MGHAAVGCAAMAKGCWSWLHSCRRQNHGGRAHHFSMRPRGTGHVAMGGRARPWGVGYIAGVCNCRACGQRAWGAWLRGTQTQRVGPWGGRGTWSVAKGRRVQQSSIGHAAKGGGVHGHGVQPTPTSLPPHCLPLLARCWTGGALAGGCGHRMQAPRTPLLPGR